MAETNAVAVCQDIAHYLAAHAPLGGGEPGGYARELLRLLAARFQDPAAPLTAETAPQRFAAAKAAWPSAFEAEETLHTTPRYLEAVSAKLNFLPAAAPQEQTELISAAYQVLTIREQRAGQGQFFTPSNVMTMMVEMLAPPPGACILDPACGVGGFLAAAHNYAVQQSHREPPQLLGFERDPFTAAFARFQLSLPDNAPAAIHRLNSLADPRHWPRETRKQVPLASLDLILANPPFSSNLARSEQHLRLQYQLGRRWSKKAGCWQPTDHPLKRQQQQILFLERCLQLLRPGGRLGIILPDGNLSNPTEEYVREYLAQNAAILAVVSLPPETFQPYAGVKTSVLFLEKGDAQSSIYMAAAPTAGRNRQGQPLYRKDPASGREVLNDAAAEIAREYRQQAVGEPPPDAPYGYQIVPEELTGRIYLPGYYHPELRQELANLRQSGRYALTSLGELVDRGKLQILRGTEVRAEDYSSGDIPYLRTTDLGNWGISLEPLKRVSPEIYERCRPKQNLQASDILLVNDGAFLIGRSVMLTTQDLRCVVQSHFRILRVTNPEELNPYYLFYLLNGDLARRQLAAKTFIQATIATLGNRLLEVELPFSKDAQEQDRIAAETAAVIADRARIREQMRRLLDRVP